MDFFRFAGPRKRLSRTVHPPARMALAAPLQPFMNSHPRRLSAYVQGFLPATLVRELSEQERLLQAVRAALPRALAIQCQHCLKHREQLIIQIESSAGATLLRFQAPALLARLATEHGLHFSDLRVRNLIPSTYPTTAVKPARNPEGNASRHLLESAKDCASEEIRSSLLRLARTLDRQGPH